MRRESIRGQSEASFVSLPVCVLADISRWRAIVVRKPTSCICSRQLMLGNTLLRRLLLETVVKGTQFISPITVSRKKYFVFLSLYPASYRNYFVCFYLFTQPVIALCAFLLWNHWRLFNWFTLKRNQTKDRSWPEKR